MADRRTLQEIQVVIPVDEGELAGDLTKPEDASGLILFAHGSGSSRRSPRNRAVAETLSEAGFATLLFDLLTPEEREIDAQTAELRFNIDLLTRRTDRAVDWVVEQPDTNDLRIGLFGASTGAAAALGAAVHRPDLVKAVVSRGGRPDLAPAVLPQVQTPTLLIIGGNDPKVIELNRRAAEQIAGQCEIEIVEGAGHLFEEPGKLKEVGQLARAWFTQHLATAP